MRALRNIAAVISILFLCVFIYFTVANALSKYADDSSLPQSLLLGLTGTGYFTSLLLVLYRYRNGNNRFAIWFSFIFSLIPLILLMIVFTLMAQVEC